MELQALYTVCGAMGGMMLASVGFLWRVNSHIERKIGKELEPIMKIIERIEKDLDSKEKWMIALNSTAASLSKDVSNLHILLGGVEKQMEKIDKTLTRLPTPS